MSKIARSISHFSRKYFSIKSTDNFNKRLKQGSLFTAILPIASCNGNKPVPDFIETQANIFSARDDTGRTLLEGSNSANLIVTGGDGNDFITTGSGNDIVDGGDGNDIINGGDGNDTLSGGDGSDIVSGGPGDDILSSGFNDGNGGSDDTLIGGEGNDILNADNSATIMIGGPGADILNGHSSVTAAYTDSPEAVNINLATQSTSGGDAAGDIINNINHVKGSAFDDIIIGNKYSNLLSGDDGNDTLLGGEGHDYLNGGAGADILDGGAGVDNAAYGDSPSAVNINLATNSASGGDAEGDAFISIEGIYGSGFNDIIVGDDQNNYLTGFDGDDTINGGDGNDDIDGSSGNDTINGEQGDDQLNGNDGNDILNGGDGDDFLHGDAGADILDGGNGIDRLLYSNSDSAVNINLAANTATGGHAEGDIFSNFENVSGSQFDDTIIGDDQDNYLWGGAWGNDTLIGGGGNDTLNSHYGDNTLNGGTGDDVLATYGTYIGDVSTYDGGLDTDALVFTNIYATLSLDVDLSNMNVSNIEILDTTNTILGANDRAEFIALTINDVLNVTDGDNELRIDGNTNDAITSIGEGWIQGVDQVIGSETYNVYEAGGATLLIDEDIPQIIS